MVARESHSVMAHTKQAGFRQKYFKNCTRIPRVCVVICTDKFYVVSNLT